MTILGSHDGNFHADDVFAIAALSLIYPDYKIVRSRDPKIWAKCDFLVDVGGVYDHEKRIYDHHFKNGPAYADGLLMSSIGLVWKHYGTEICGSEKISQRVCYKIIRTLDAHDNGINLTEKANGIPNVDEVSISSIIAVMNPPNLDDVDEIFAEEVLRAAKILKAYIAHAEKWFDSLEEVKTALNLALNKQQQFLEVSENCKWQEHLHHLPGNEKILFVLYPSEQKWYSRTVPLNPGNYKSRKLFPESWGGLRDEEFSKVAKIEDGVFCHHSRFICASNSKKSTLELIQQAISEN